MAGGQSVAMMQSTSSTPPTRRRYGLGPHRPLFLSANGGPLMDHPELTQTE